MPLTVLEVIWTALLLANTVPFGAYLLYMRNLAIHRPWDIKIDPTYEPNVSILLVTYNEEALIERKLDSIIESAGITSANYPVEKMEIVIVDGASTDETLLRVAKWRERNPRVRVNVFVESSREGMVHAENIGLNLAKYDILVKTDVDCFFQKDALKNALKYLSDPKVGAVTGLHQIDSNNEGMSVEVERKYRDLYAWLRVGESKIFGTVMFEGELLAFKRKVLEKLGGFDQDIGGDDIPLALKMAKNGYRAISASDSYFVELVPYTWKARFSQKIRRGKHVIQALWKYRGTKMNGGLSDIFVPIESFIYMVNPFLFLALCGTSVVLFLEYPILLVALLPIVLIKRIRDLFTTHATNSMIMVGAMFRLVFGSRGKNDLIWSKVVEIHGSQKEGDEQRAAPAIRGKN